MQRSFNAQACLHRACYPSSTTSPYLSHARRHERVIQWTSGPLAVLFGTLYREAIMFVCDRMGVRVEVVDAPPGVFTPPVFAPYRRR